MSQNQEGMRRTGDMWMRVGERRERIRFQIYALWLLQLAHAQAIEFSCCHMNRLYQDPMIRPGTLALVTPLSHEGDIELTSWKHLGINDPFR